jgi:hypothetical protein
LAAKEANDLKTRREELEVDAQSLGDQLDAVAARQVEEERHLRLCQEAMKEAALQLDERRWHLLSRRANALHRCLEQIEHHFADMQRLSLSESDKEKEKEEDTQSLTMHGAIEFVHHELRAVLAALEGLQEKHPARLKTYTYESCNENGSSHVSVEEDGQAFDALEIRIDRARPGRDEGGGEMQSRERQAEEEVVVEEEHTQVVDTESETASLVEQISMMSVTAERLRVEIQVLSAQMEAASEGEDYEQAATLHDAVEVKTAELREV